MMFDEQALVATIGAGPVVLAAAAHLQMHGLQTVTFPKGPSAAMLARVPAE
jgi:thioredoxin reductase